MWAWFRRLWDYLRRLFMDDDVLPPSNDDPPPAVEGRPAPSDRIGKELQEFFLELLKGKNMKRYQSVGRETFIEEYVRERPGELGDDAQRLLNSADLREIEAHIGQISGSRAVILYVVCPPM